MTIVQLKNDFVQFCKPSESAEGNSDNIMSAKGINMIPSSPASPKTTPALVVDPPPSSVCNRLVRNHQEQLCGPVLKREKVAQNLRNQQQYLLLLHHASECPAVASEGENPHCAQMKDSWKHMTRCDDIHCTVAGCYYGRRVLYHYHRCKKKIRCQLCGPVLREKVAQRNQVRQANRVRQINENAVIPSSTTTQQRPRKKPKMSKVDSLKPSNPGLRGT